MANFPPLKPRFLEALDAALRRHPPVQGLFLDFGCGSGDVALHLIHRWGLKGELVEPSPEARARLAQTPELSKLPCHEGIPESRNVHGEGFALAVAFDVLEHLPEPALELTRLHAALDGRGDDTGTQGGRIWGAGDEGSHVSVLQHVAVVDAKTEVPRFVMPAKAGIHPGRDDGFPRTRE